MGLTERLSQAFVGDVGVNLGRRQRRVPEHLLNATQVGPTFQQVRGHRVTQAVRARLDAGVRA